jgi:ATP-dependent DNA helicase RecG
LADLIASSEGINTLDLATRRGKSKPTVERYLKLAKLLGVIEFQGASKTGGYYLTKKMKEKLKV